ncbi:MAG: M20 family metallopeptidase [Burkholderiaceae bacterium]
MNDIERAVCAWLDANEASMRALLAEVVNIDSGSSNKAGVDRVSSVLRAKLEEAGIPVRMHALAEHGDCLQADLPGSDGASDAPVLLLGHMDTVFPDGTVAERPFRIDGDMAYGPGVADMKSGLVMNLFVALAFKAVGGNALPVRLFFSGDEEIASPSSRGLIMEAARGVSAVLNAEPARPSGNVVTGRKGAFFIDFEVDGVAAHAGVNHAKGVSAIEAMARKISALHALTDYEQGVTANVGTVHGGVSVNTVAPYAKAQLDVRFPSQVDQASLHAQIQQIIEAAELPCTCGRIKREGIFLPLIQNEAGAALLQVYRGQTSKLDFDVAGEFTGGSADSGLTSAVGAPTLCATGPVGGNPHTDQEYCRIDTLVPRAKAVALTILDLARSKL